MSVVPQKIRIHRRSLDDFVEKAFDALLNEHPDWMNPNSNDGASICSPPYFETVRKNLESEESPSDLLGNLGDSTENKVFTALKNWLKIGAVVVANFDTADVERQARVVWKEYAALYDQQLSNTNNDPKAHFQCDFMLFHRLAGIILIEVKSTDNQPEEAGKVVVVPEKAKKQIKKLMEKMRLFYQAVTDTECDVPINGAICCPKFCYSDTANSDNDPDISIIHKKVFETKENFCLFWQTLIGRLSNEHGGKNLYVLETFQKFIGFSASYRSAYYLNGILNAVQVAKLVVQQRLQPKESPKKTQKHCKSAQLYEHCFNEERRQFPHEIKEDQAIFLTEHQRAAARSTAQRQIIYGPPGTGKTLILIVKLLRALRQKKPDSDGEIIIVSHKAHRGLSERLKKIIAVHCPTGRQPKFVENFFYIKKEDDVFCDELSTMDVSFLKSRLDATGSTVCVLTGNYYGNDYSKMKSYIMHLSDQYEVHLLSKIMRGTRNIVNHWLGEIWDQDANNMFKVGHGIDGPVVPDANVYPTVYETMSAVYGHVRELLDAGTRAKDIAIIVDEEHEAELLRQFLTERDVSVATVCGQINEPNSVAVDDYDNTLSMEWPFVIVCSLACTDWYDNVRLIASSRAIAHLAFFNLDYNSMQIYVERYLDKLQDPADPAELQSHVGEAVKNYFKGNNEQIHDEETLKRCIKIQYLYYVLRLDIMPFTRSGSFHDCQQFTDCLKLITDNQTLMRKFVPASFLIYTSTKEEIDHCTLEYSKVGDRVQMSAIRCDHFLLRVLKTSLDSPIARVSYEFAKQYALHANTYLMDQEKNGCASSDNNADMKESSAADEGDADSEIIKKIILLSGPLLWIDYAPA